MNDALISKKFMVRIAGMLTIRGRIMLNQEKIEIALEEMARQQDHKLYEHERLAIRTRINCALSAKGQQWKRMNAPEYKWKKLMLPRR